MSAEERLLTEITLTSPEGNIHTGRFRASNDPRTKSQGIFKTIGGNGGRVQDLGADLRTSNYVVYFVGENHDLESEAFMKSLDEDGAWTIDHPVRGRLQNQFPAGFDPSIDPVQSGNITAIATVWTTDYPEDQQISQIQRASNITAAVADVNEGGIKGFFDNVSAETANLKNKISQGTDLMISSVNNTIGPLLETVEGATDIMTATANGINSTIDAATLQVTELAAQCQFFCQLPAQLLNNTKGRLSAFSAAIDGILSDSLTGTPDEQKNQAVTNQMTVTGLFCGLSLSVISNPDIQTRIQAIEASELIRTMFDTMTDALDEYGKIFDDLLYHDRYFSQTDTFISVAELTAQAQAYLLDLSVSLKKEKIVKLNRPLSAYFAALDFYGNADDETVDLLIETNNLSLSRIMVIEAATKLVIYV